MVAGDKKGTALDDGGFGEGHLGGRLFSALHQAGPVGFPFSLRRCSRHLPFHLLAVINTALIQDIDR